MEVRLRSCQSPEEADVRGQEAKTNGAQEQQRLEDTLLVGGTSHPITKSGSRAKPFPAEVTELAMPSSQASLWSGPKPPPPRFTPHPLIPFQIPPATTQMLMSNNLSNPPLLQAISLLNDSALPAWKIRPHMFFTTPHMSS